MITRTTCYDWQFDAQENDIYIINLSEEFQGYHISLEVELESATRMVGQINYINLSNDHSSRLDFSINDTEGTLCLTRVETTTSFLVFTRNTFLTFTTYVSYGDSRPWNYRPALIHLVKGNYNTAMKLAAEGGHRDLVDFFIFKGADNWDFGMKGAARGGHRDLVDFFISKGADNWNRGMFGAAKGGHRDLVDFFISKGARDWNWAMQGASLGGHRDLVKFFISKGAI